MSTEFYIINYIDCPDSRHVVIKNLGNDGEGRYNLADNGLRGYLFTNFDNATKLEDFGIVIKEVSNGWYCFHENYSLAKYKDGEPRQWQGAKEFIIT